MTDIDDDVRVFGTFYKYREFPAKADALGWERLENMLLKQEIFFPSPSTLNDPFDCYPRIELLGSALDIRRKAADLLAEILADQGMNITPAYRRSGEFAGRVTDFIADLRNERFRNEKLLDAIDQNTGVYCMSRKNNSILQWSYYGGGHAGLCLEFSVSAKSEPPFDQVAAMEYVGDRESIDLFDVVGPNNIHFVWRLVRRKFKDWDHEDEVRAFVPAPGLRVFTPGSLTSIVFGTKTSNANKQWVRDRVGKVGLKVQYHQAIQSYTHFALDIQPVCA